MEINYQETSKDLLVRIDIHEKYGSANIDQWTNELLKPQAGMNILDVGCGAGKLSFLFNDYTKGGAKITGGDFSEALLDKARAKNKERGTNIDFQFLDFNKPFNFADNTFDLCTSAFAIYYASDLDFTFGEAHRVLNEAGAFDGLRPCSAAHGPKEPLATPRPKLFDAIAELAYVDASGRGHAARAVREPSAKLRVTVDGAEALVTVGSGAQVVLADLDLDGTPELVTTANEGDDRLVVTSLGAKPLPRLRLDAKEGVRALGTCPPEAQGRPVLVAAVGQEVWLVR